ncbi:MAG: hypothetical protein IPQ05_18045 [Leptospiraceae bacterium]|nr:hypothetical protein [Leptospiraceae bacterium]
MICSNPLVNLFKGYGYCLINMPNNRIKLMDLYIENGKKLEPYGNLEGVFETSKRFAYPESDKSYSTMDKIELISSGLVDIEIGLKPFSNFIQAFGGLINADLGVAFSKVKKVKFELNQCKTKELPYSDIQNYIYSTHPLKKTASEKDLKDEKIYVVYSLLQSNSFYFSAYDENEQEIELNIKVEGLLENENEVKHNANHKKKMLYTGKKYLTFGVALANILYSKKEDKFCLEKEDNKVVVRGNEKIQVRHYEIEDAFLDL